jgi:hypothetical protein
VSISTANRRERALLRIDIHLTVTTIKLKRKHATVGESQREGLAPLMARGGVLQTIAQRITDAMTALHDGAVATPQLVGRRTLGTVEGCCLAVGNIIKVVIGIGRSF